MHMGILYNRTVIPAQRNGSMAEALTLCRLSVGLVSLTVDSYVLRVGAVMDAHRAMSTGVQRHISIATHNTVQHNISFGRSLRQISEKCIFYIASAFEILQA